MKLNKDYLKKVWNSVWEEDLSELEVQKLYFAKLDNELKGQDRFHLMAVGRKINELEMNTPFTDLLSNRIKANERINEFTGLQDARTEGDGTEWIIEKDKKGNLYKRAIGSVEKIYLEKKSKESK